MAPATPQISKLATRLKALHQPGKPVLLANVQDTLSANAVASLPSTKALATASYAVALAHGTADDDLTLEQNLDAAAQVGAVGLAHDIPVSVDFQDGYGDKLEKGIGALVERGVVGVNLEDYSREHDRFYTIAEQSGRIKKVLETANGVGVKDFVVNARCDILVQGGDLQETVKRGKAYLDAGATCVFVWGGSKRGVSKAEVQEMVREFGGRLNISLKLGAKDGLKIKQVAELGVSRVSVGPAVMFMAMEEFKRVAGGDC